MHPRVAVEHQAVGLLERFGAFRSPPEPPSAAFVKGAPDDGHAGVAQLGEFPGDEIHLPYELRVLRRPWLQRAANVE